MRRKKQPRKENHGIGISEQSIQDSMFQLMLLTPLFPPTNTPTQKETLKQTRMLSLDPLPIRRPLLLDHVQSLHLQRLLRRQVRRVHAGLQRHRRSVQRLRQRRRVLHQRLLLPTRHHTQTHAQLVDPLHMASIVLLHAVQHRVRPRAALRLTAHSHTHIRLAPVLGGRVEGVLRELLLHYDSQHRERHTRLAR